MPYGNVNTKIKVVNDVAVGTEADVVAAPASGKRWRFHRFASISTDTAGLFIFQASATAVDEFVIYLAANTTYTNVELGSEGILFAVDKAVSCDGPASSKLTANIVVTEE